MTNKLFLDYGIYEKENRLAWNSISWSDDGFISDWSRSDSVWNISYELPLEELKKGAFITITLDTSSSYIKNGEKYKGDFENNVKNGEFYRQKMYINGQVIFDGDYNKQQWELFKSQLSNLKYFCIGRSSMYQDSYWHYSKMSAYCLRLYSRALTEEEVSKNYEKSVEYHSLLTK